MLGRVDANGVNPNRTLPAAHFLYPWCFASACESVPYDPRSFSYMGSALYTPGAEGMANNLQAVATAVSAYKSGAGATSLNPTAGIDTMIMGQANKAFSAGAFVCVTYLPLLTILGSPEATINAQAFDVVNYRLNPQIRTNTINAGLVLITPQVLRFGNAFYPSAGIAPVFKEEYQELTIERRMLLPSFNLAQLAQYVNCVNGSIEKLSIAGVQTPLAFQSECLRFSKFTTQYVQVPQVDSNGEPNGYNRWLNLRLEYDWRQVWSTSFYDATGRGPQLGQPGWNHVLAWIPTV